MGRRWWILSRCFHGLRTGEQVACDSGLGDALELRLGFLLLFGFFD
jgi:hypothetical protein